ncbi:CLUMA_CG001447, isoform A [Clunio marinus]|uniref:CLUMA_CG001447, isoform A n=1 Tax=Clunio marinus TaxID=568069 RepID=A0A1J1HMH1_9DIPT|nr:CLUMA_CG001447, isoform A [Clunio marinus]
MVGTEKNSKQGYLDGRIVYVCLLTTYLSCHHMCSKKCGTSLENKTLLSEHEENMEKCAIDEDILTSISRKICVKLRTEMNENFPK